MRIDRHLSLVLALTFFTSNACAAPPKSTARPAALRPLTFANVVAFFQEALGHPALKTDARIALFAEGEWANPNVYNHSVIFVENADEDVEITFIMSGDEGMNWVNEFFDSAFFTRSETESFFQLLNNGTGKRRAKLGRFAVEFSRWQPHHHEIVVLSLTPRKQ